MKNLKLLPYLFLCVIFFNCFNNAEEEGPIDNDTPVIVLDSDAVIGLQSGTDITNIVTFDGQNAGTYTSVLEVGASVTVDKPQGLKPNDQLLFTSAKIYDSAGNEVVFDPDNRLNNLGGAVSADGKIKILVPEGKPTNYYEDLENGNGIPTIVFQAFDSEENVDTEYKYDIEVKIIRDGTVYGPYLIDPKIKIRSRGR